MKTQYDFFDEYRKELKRYLEDGTVKDPAVFWSGRMSQLVKVVCNTPIVKMHSYTFELLDLVRQEYDEIMFSRAKPINHNSEI